MRFLPSNSIGRPKASLGFGCAVAILTWQISYIQSVPKVLGNTIFATVFVVDLP